MTSDRNDHAPIVEAWLKEPIFLPEGDTARVARLVHQTPQQRGWLRRIFTERTSHMYTATKLVTAGAIIAAAGGFLLYSGGLLPQLENDALPAATVEASAAPDVTPAPDVTTAPEASLEVDPPTEATPDGALVLGAPDPELGAAGWAQIGTAPYTDPDGTGFGELSRLQVVGDVLVALGSAASDVENEQSRDAVFTSTDGQTWAPAFLPGTKPVLNDLASTTDGVVVGGLDRVDGQRVAKLWSSSDGREWVEIPAPEGAAVIDQIVSAQDPLAVRSNQRLYLQETDGSWTDLDRIPNSQILRGPGGYLIWQGGGQDLRFQLSLIHKAELDGPIREVALPGRLGRGNLAEIGIQLFAVGDQWVMVPEGVDTPIYVSPDGFDWQELPRPDRMLGGSVEWVGQIGDELQAFGLQYRSNRTPSGVWTIDPAATEAAAFDVLDRDGEQHMGAPVAFRDGYVATGLFTGRGHALSAWEHAAQ